MPDSNPRPSWWRAPAWVALIAAIALPIAGTWSAPHPTTGQSEVILSITILDVLRDMAPEFGMVLLLGAGVTWVGCGLRGVRDGLVSLVGFGRDHAAAARALTLWARGTTAAGFVLGVLGFLGLVFLAKDVTSPDDLPAPQDSAAKLHTTLVAAIGGLLVGRVILGACAEAARRRAGLSRPVFSAGADWGLLVLLVPPVLVFVLVLVPWQV